MVDPISGKNPRDGVEHMQEIYNQYDTSNISETSSISGSSNVLSETLPLTLPPGNLSAVRKSDDCANERKVLDMAHESLAGPGQEQSLWVALSAQLAMLVQTMSSPKH